MSSAAGRLDIPTAKVFQPLLEPARYKGAWGGRGSGKSHNFVDNGIDDCLRYPGDHGSGLNFVCIREVQKTLEQSAKKLFENKLRDHGLGERDGFKVYKSVIETPGDGIIIFQGMQDHTAESIKSLEDFHRAWVEEAQTLSAHSLKLLRPTIRADLSELWFSWNPTRKVDPVDVMLRQGIAPTNSVVVNANWSDNPWFPAVLEQERLDCLRDEPDQYENIWNGDYVGISKGAYYAKQLALAKQQGRTKGRVAVDPLAPIRVFCDLGGSGATSDAFVMWVAQFIGKEIRILDYYEAQGQDLATHVAWLDTQGYGPGKAKIWLPHDGKAKPGPHDVSFESAFREIGYKVVVVENQGRGAAKARIEAGRRLFPSMWFDNNPNVEAGLGTLAWYHEKFNAITGIGLGPDHDWSSHGADGFGLMCVAHEAPRPVGKPIKYAGWNG